MRTARIAHTLIAAAAVAFAQAPPGGPPGGPNRPGGVRPQRPQAYPDRPPPDPAVLARGKAMYGVYCNFCHGSDARGGEGGPNLLRSEMVLQDQNGEGIARIVLNGRGDMPKIPLKETQIADVATFIHSFKVGGYDISRMVPPTILVGDAKEGEAAFQKRCGSCHSVTKDLKGFAARFTDDKALQNTWLMPSFGGGRGGRGGNPNLKPVTVTITPPSGPRIEGRLIRIDDFVVTIRDADGGQRTIRRDGDSPKVEIHDPLKPHRDMLPTYSDREIHNLTSYLVTLK